MTSIRPARTDQSFPRLSARTSRFTLGIPGAATISPDGATVLFLRSRSGTDSTGLLWRRDVRAGTDTLLVDPHRVLGRGEEHLPVSERARRERLRESGAGVTGYDVDNGFRTAVVALSGRVFAVDVATGRASEVSTPGPAVDPRVSPDGRWVACHTLGALQLSPSRGDGSSGDLNRPRQLAGEDDPAITWGLADFIHAEELGRTRGHWWSPDSDGVLATRVDESDVLTWHVTDPARPEQAPRSIRYPAAGTTNARTQLWWLGVDGSRSEVAWDTEVFPYLGGVRWQAGRAALIWVLARDQRSVRILGWQPGSQPQVLREIHDDAWVDIVPGTPTWLGDRLLTVEPQRGDEDEDEYRLLADGEPVMVGVQVRAVTSAADGTVTATVMTEPARRRAVHVTAPGRWRWLGGVDGVTTARHTAGTTVLREDTPEQETPALTVLSTTGSAPIQSLSVRPPVRPRPVHLTRRHSDDPRVAVLTPTEPAEQPLPILLDPYGGPHGQRVLDSARAHLESQWWAEQGFVVVVADGPGTPGSPRWERAMAGSLGRPALAAQVRALEMLADQLPGVGDPQKVAIRGWSFGGYLAALAVLERPDLVHAAVAGAPVTDWSLYDTAYTERYLGLPRDHPHRYVSESLLDKAASLRRPLLLIHGTSDDNVVMAHTLRLSSALLAAGRAHQVLPLSGVTHMTPQEDVAQNLLLLQRDFILGSLPREGPTPSG